MRFKQWLSEEKGLMQWSSNIDFGTNDDMPYGVRSKWVTKDAIPSKQQDPQADMQPPEKAFGFRSPKDLKASKERRSQVIDKRRDNSIVPMRLNVPDIIY